MFSINPALRRGGTSAVPDANPGRPTVSTPAALTPVGYLQFENGTLFAEQSTEFSNRFGASQVTKLAVLPRLELILESEPLAISQCNAKQVPKADSSRRVFRRTCKAYSNQGSQDSYKGGA
jgi:hypothetical protein